ncbi:MAG: hypothetical protein JNK21_12420 [Rhodospirillaceae bacterium]|nr:hypothetical protein [Rhodospirillaceae bacterium]
MSLFALEPPADLPPGPFLSVFVVHEILDAAKYAAYQQISDGQSLKPRHFGGDVVGFAKPPINFAVADSAVAVAVIKWPDFDSYRRWRGQPIYQQPGVPELHAAAERESVYFIPISTAIG